MVIVKNIETGEQVKFSLERDAISFAKYSANRLKYRIEVYRNNYLQKVLTPPKDF